MDSTPNEKVTATHTPGPWSFTGEHFKHDGSAIIMSPATPGSKKDKFVACALDFNRFDRDAEVEANARLIASAPDLLSELKDALTTLNQLLVWEYVGAVHFPDNSVGPQIREQFKQAAAVVERAEGRQS